MKHLKTVLVWAGVSAVIILYGLFIHQQEPKMQGPLIAGTLFLVSLWFICRIWRRG